MNLLPLGTIIKINGYKACVMGYTSAEKETKSVMGYWVVIYPLGYISSDKMFFVPHCADFEIVAEGYRTNASEKLLNTIASAFEKIEDVSYEELEKFMDAYKKIVLPTKGESE